MTRKIAWPGLLLLLGGCALQTRVRQAPLEAGSERLHAAGADAVMEAVDRALAAEGYDRREAGWAAPGRRSVVATCGLGRAARVLVEEHPTDCRVWILVRSALGDAAGDEARAAGLHGRLARTLGGARDVAPAAAAEREAVYTPELTALSATARDAAVSAGFVVQAVDEVAGEMLTLSGSRDDGTRLFVALYRRPEGGTRLVAEARGPGVDAAELVECALESAAARDAAAELASDE